MYPHTHIHIHIPLLLHTLIRHHVHVPSLSHTHHNVQVPSLYHIPSCVIMYLYPLCHIPSYVIMYMYPLCHIPSYVTYNNTHLVLQEVITKIYNVLLFVDGGWMRDNQVHHSVSSPS